MALAPAKPADSSPADLNDPVQRYAFEREAEHLWRLDAINEALISLSARTSPVPRDNLRRWRLWLIRIEAVFGSDHPVTFIVRNNIAHWTGESGDAPEALRLFQRLLSDRSAYWDPTTRRRSKREAISLTLLACAEMPGGAKPGQGTLLPDQERVLGSITRTRSLSVTISLSGPVSAGMPARRCNCSKGYSLTRNACWDPITPKHSRHATISPSRSTTAEMFVKRYDCLRRWLPTRCVCSVTIIPSHSSRQQYRLSDW